MSTFMRGYSAILFLVFAIGMQPLWAQGFLGRDISPQEKEAFQRRVKGVEQFMKRFNYQEDPAGNSTASLGLSPAAFAEGRKSSLVYLLDYAHYSNVTAEEEAQALRFVDYVNQADSSAIFLDFYDQNWYALLTLDAAYQGKPVQLQLSLQNEVVGDKQSKWVIVGAKAEFLQMEAEEPSAFLPPNASGTNFIDVTDALENPSNAIAYSSNQYQLDPLTLFFAQLKLGLLKVNRVKEVEFHFLQVPGWAFVVKEYNRLEAPNSGWLISSIAPLLNRSQYQNSVLGITASK